MFLNDQRVHLRRTIFCIYFADPQSHRNNHNTAKNTMSVPHHCNSLCTSCSHNYHDNPTHNPFYRQGRQLERCNLNRWKIEMKTRLIYLLYLNSASEKQWKVLQFKYLYTCNWIFPWCSHYNYNCQNNCPIHCLYFW